MQVEDQDAAFIAGADATPVADTGVEVEEAQAAAPEAEAQSEGGKPEPEATPEGEGDEKPEGEKRTPWFQRRIDDLTREKHDARREAEALRAELARLATQSEPEAERPAGEVPGTKQAPPADPREIARQMVETERFNEACNKVYETGTTEFKDFDSALGNFKLLGGLPNEVVEAALEAGDAHRIIYTLGKDPDEAARILSLPPVRMAAAVAKLAAKPAPTKQVSQVPDPPKPIGGRAEVELDPDKMPIDQWMKWHDEQQARKRA